MKEIWKDIDWIEGFEGLYQVSNLGRVKSLTRVVNCSSTYSGKYTVKGRIIKTRKDPQGYVVVGLYNEGKRKTCRIHRLVAEAFIPNPNGHPVVNHKDEDKTNNIVSNLEWCSVAYNNSYGTRTQRATATTIKKKNFCKKVRCITTGKEFDSLKEAGEYYKCNLQHEMNRIVRGKQKHCGRLEDGTLLSWEYIDKES